MRHQIGEKSLSIWFEILSIADRNEGELPGDYEELVRSVSGKCQSSVTKVSLVCDFAKTRLWLVSDPTLRVRNYLKYHRTREPNEIPRGNKRGSPPILTRPDPTEPLKIKTPLTPQSEVAPSAVVKKKLDPWVKEVADRIYALGPQRFSRLIVWIKKRERMGFSAEMIIKALELFEPHAMEVSNWWPYLERLGQKVRTEMLQGEAEQYKHSDLTQVGVILRKMATR